MKPHASVRSDRQTETATAEFSELLAHRRHLVAWLHAAQMRLDNAASKELRQVLTTQVNWLAERLSSVDAELVHTLQVPIRSGACGTRCRKTG
jgi:hypothetical protein